MCEAVERYGRQMSSDAAATPPRRRGRPRDHDSAETRQRVLEVARRLFAENGYDATTNRAIAEASGLTAGALYHYFESKADLYAAVYAQVYDRVYNTLDAAIIGHQTLVGQFTAAMTAVGELNVSDPTLPAFDRGVAGEAQVHPELNELLKPVRRRNALVLPPHGGGCRVTGRARARRRSPWARGSVERRCLRRGPHLRRHRRRRVEPPLPSVSSVASSTAPSWPLRPAAPPADRRTISAGSQSPPVVAVAASVPAVAPPSAISKPVIRNELSPSISAVNV